MSTRSMFCAVCGTKQPPFVDNLCGNCYYKEYPPEISTVEEVSVEICPSCESIKIGGGAVIETFDTEQSFEEIIRDVGRSVVIEKLNVDGPYRVEFLEDNIDDSKVMNRGVKTFNMLTKVIVRPHQEFEEYDETLSTTLRLLRTTCQNCIQYKTGHHEAILQVRGTNRKLLKKEEIQIEDVTLQVASNFGNPKTSYVFEYEAEEEGVTAKVSTKRLAEAIAKRLKVVMAGKYTVAYKLVTRTRDDLDVHENTYLVRLPEYIEGDITEFGGDIWQVKSVQLESVALISLENHEIKHFERKKFDKEARKRNNELVRREYMVLSEEGNTVMIMGMDNYENFEENKKKIPESVEVGETVRGFLFNEKNYYVELEVPHLKGGTST